MSYIQPEKIPKAIIFMGIPASGKSTFYQERFSGEFTHINLDTLHTRNKETKLLEECLRKKISFVVDNTNPTESNRKRYIEAAKQNGYEIEGYFFQSIIADCIKRNSGRQGKACVPNTAIAGISNQLELPSYREGFHRLYFVHIQAGKFIVNPWND